MELEMRHLNSMEESIMGKPKPKKATTNEIQSGALQRESPPPEFLEQIEAVYRLIGRYLGQTLEEFKIGFMRDSRPEDEVAMWCKIATAWCEYHDRFLDGDRLSDDQEKRIVAALVAISAGEEDVHCLPVAAEVGAQLLAGYDGIAGA
jgi:hypothetical protein